MAGHQSVTGQEGCMARLIFLLLISHVVNLMAQLEDILFNYSTNICIIGVRIDTMYLDVFKSFWKHISNQIWGLKTKHFSPEQVQK